MILIQMNTQNKLSILEKISYGVGDMGCNFIWFLVAIQATFFYTEYYLSTMSVDPTVKDGFSYHLIGTFFGTEKSRWPQSLRFRSSSPYLLVHRPILCGVCMPTLLTILKWKPVAVQQE